MCHCKQKREPDVQRKQESTVKRWQCDTFTALLCVAVQCLAASCCRVGVFFEFSLTRTSEWMESNSDLTAAVESWWIQNAAAVQRRKKKIERAQKPVSTRHFLERQNSFFFFLLLCRILLVSWNFLRHSSTSHGALDSSSWLRNMRKLYRSLPFAHFDRPAFFFLLLLFLMQKMC